MKTKTLAAALACTLVTGATAESIATPDLRLRHVVPQITHVVGDGEMTMEHAYAHGELMITSPYSRATLPNAPVGGGFMQITNLGTQDDRLIGARSEAAGHMEIHEMAMDGDVMRMRELPDGLTIPAGETVDLRPGGFHIMFMQLRHPLVEANTVNVTLIFEKAGEVTLPFMIGPKNAGANGQMQMMHGNGAN